MRDSPLRRLLLIVLQVADVVFLPVLVPAALLLKAIRRVGIHRLPRCRGTLRWLGIFPIRQHYYEPLFHGNELSRSLRVPRNLPGIDWNMEEQRALVAGLTAGHELHAGQAASQCESVPRFIFDNPSFGAGDAEVWYSMIRHKRPASIIEIGSGNSTLLARQAIARNKTQDSAYNCRHICIEPYEARWLESLGVEVLRQPVEDLPLDLFGALGADDFLFIDSSHMIRPQGDILTEYLEIIPGLHPGVIVHIHDIFSPRDYPDEWIQDQVRFWNEQYLLEAFLTNNGEWKVIAALNHLRHEHFDLLHACCPFLTAASEPGSFYMQKVFE